MTGKLPPPAAVKDELRELVQAAGKLVVAYEEAYEAGLSPAGRGMIATRGGGFAGGEESDPTGETAVVTPDPRRIRGAVRSVARAIRRASRDIDDAQGRLLSAFLDTDPDLRHDRLARHSAALQGVSDAQPHRRNGSVPP